MDNFYSSPFLFYNLKLAFTGAVGTLRSNCKCIPREIQNAKLRLGEEKVMPYGKEKSMLKIYDRKPVLLLKCYHYQQYIIRRQRVDTEKNTFHNKRSYKEAAYDDNKYNKYRVGLDANDQLLKNAHFSRRTLKWWKKVFFSLLNICMVNPYILEKECFGSNDKQYNNTHTDFRIQVISKLTDEGIYLDDLTITNQSTEAFNRLTGRHFPKKIPVPPASKSNNLF